MICLRSRSVPANLSKKLELILDDEFFLSWNVNEINNHLPPKIFISLSHLTTNNNLPQDAQTKEAFKEKPYKTNNLSGNNKYTFPDSYCM